MDLMTKLVGVPLYIQIRESLRKAIQDGDYTPGNPIPPENVLAETYHVSRMTVRHAIDGLQDEGLVYRRQGTGTFVTHHRIPHDYSRLISSFDMVQQAGLEPGTRTLCLEIQPAKEHVAQRLSLAPGDSVVCFERLRLASGQPVAIVCSYVPQKLCPPTILDDIPNHNSLFELLESYGLRLARGIQTIEVRYADRRQSGLLDVAQGEAIVYVERLTFAEDGTPVDLAFVHNRADTYTCNIMLSR